MTTIAPVPPLPDHLVQRGGDPRLVYDEVIGIIRQRIDQAPRTLQKRIGPSEIGDPCARKLGHKLAGTLPPDDRRDRWRPQVGTFIHAGLEDWLHAANRRHREQHGDSAGTRWLLEQPVDVGTIGGETITGRCDVLDRVTATQIDWKSASASRLKHYRAHGPGAQYEAQAHLYALGWERRGFTVDTVMLIFLPRDGELRDAFCWSAPYDRQAALSALARANRIDAAVKVLGAEAYTITNGELDARGLSMLASQLVNGVVDPNRADALALPLDYSGCRFCSLFKPGATDLSVGCPGDSSAAPRRDSTLEMLA